MTSKLHNFPGFLNPNSKGRRHKLKTKGKSPHDIKTHHNLYIAYIKGNTRRIKPAVKNTNYNALNKVKFCFNHLPKIKLYEILNKISMKIKITYFKWIV